MKPWCSALVVCAILQSSAAIAQDLPLEWQGVLPEPPRPRSDLSAASGIRRGAGSDVRLDYDSADYALLSAARGGDWASVLRQIKSGTRPNVSDAWGDNVLVRAATAGETDVVRALIAAGANVERRGTSGYTPLGAASVAGHHEIVALLLKAGADVEAKSANGHAPLIDAVRFNRTQVVAELIRVRPSWWSFDVEKGRHALALAASLGHVQVMAQLIDIGFDPSLRDKGGFNALYWALFYKQRQAVAHLLAAGVNPGAMSTDIYD